MQRGQCNECLQSAKQRVEIRTATQRMVVCGRCAVRVLDRCAERHESATVVPFAERPVSRWVCSDESYFADEGDARAHQRMLDNHAASYAARVNRFVQDLRQFCVTGEIAAD